MEDFERELQQVFLSEAAQIVADAEQCYLTLESQPNERSVIEKIFRLVHNLKGSSKAVGFDELGAFTHELESFLLKVKNGELAVSKAIVSLLLRCNDQISQMIDGLHGNRAAHFDCSGVLSELRQAALGEFSQAEVSGHDGDLQPQPSVGEKAPENGWGMFHPVAEAPETSQVSGGAAVPAPESPQRHTPPSKQAAPAASSSGDESIRISLHRLEKLINFVGEVVILQTVLREQTHDNSNPFLRKTVHQLGKVTKEVQDISMSLRMVPLRQTFQKMQRIVRDTSASLGKSVQLSLHGEDTELDKTILEKISDPLVHLIRNAVDHGIESPETRAKTQKPEQGNVQLSAYHQSGKIVIEVQDDGGGMDPARLCAKAVEKGLIRSDHSLSDREAYNLIFKPGFSTKAVVTDVSGRGVGMDVVKTNIEALQGEIVLSSEIGKGSCFKIVLPLTLAIIDGLIVKTGDERYVLPLTHVHESVRPSREDVHPSTSLGQVFSLRGEQIPLFSLSALIGRPNAVKPAWESIAIVVRVLETPFAILVDDIFGQSQVVIKKLGEEHQNLVGVSGSAILGDGKAALILEIADLVKANGNTQGLRRAAA